MKRVNLGFASLLVALAATAAWAQDTAAPVAGPKKGLEGLWALILAIVVAIIALVISLGLGMVAVKKAIDMFDKSTKGVDEWAELRKGNVAVGIVLAAMIFSIANVISGGVAGLTGQLMKPELSLAYVLQIVVGVINLLIALFISTNVIALTLKFLDKSTKDIDEMSEIAKGNTAVAVMVAGVLLGVSTIISAAVQNLSSIVRVESITGLFG
jgi:uncharacterized membrane protein YjfL (UPF0719 family)